MSDDKNYVRLPHANWPSFRPLMIRAVQQKAPLESLLRSALLVLMDNTTAEYTFITTFFSPDANLIPVRKESPMSPLIGQSSLSPMVLDDEIGTLSATTSTSLVATPVTVDSNSNLAHVHSLARGATPQSNPPSQLSKEDQAALAAVWKQITDPAVEYIQVSTIYVTIVQSNGFPCGNNNCYGYATAFLLHRINRTSDLCQVVHGTNSPNHSAADYDSPDGRYRKRDSTARVCPSRDCAVHHEVADVACIPEGHVRTRGSTQKVCGWRIWLRVRR